MARNLADMYAPEMPQDPRIPKQAPGMGPAAEQAPEQAPEDLMAQVEEVPLDEEHMAEEAEEPAFVQYLEEQLGVEIPKEIWPEIEKYLASKGIQDGKLGMSPKAPVAPAPEKKTNRMFGVPQG